MRHCVMPSADDALCVWKTGNRWLLKTWNWAKKMKLLWNVFVLESFRPSSSSSSARGISWEGQAGLFLSVLRKAMPPWFHYISNLFLAQREDRGGDRGHQQQSHPITEGVGWRIRSLYPSSYQFCDLRLQFLVLGSFDSGSGRKRHLGSWKLS